MIDTYSGRGKVIKMKNSGIIKIYKNKQVRLYKVDGLRTVTKKLKNGKEFKAIEPNLIELVLG